MRRVVLAALLVAAAGLIAFDAPAQAENASAAIFDNTYKHGDCENSAGGGNFSINVGESVTWKNCGQNNHTVTGNSFGDTIPITPGSSRSHTFATAGTFPYHCNIHSNMHGSVTVTDAASTTTATTDPPATTPPTPPPTPVATTRATTSTTIPPSTTSTVDNFGGVFDEQPTGPTTSTIFDPSAPTTRALGTGGEGSASGGTVALLLVGLIGVGFGVALLARRLSRGTQAS